MATLLLKTFTVLIAGVIFAMFGWFFGNGAVAVLSGAVGASLGAGVVTEFNN